MQPGLEVYYVMLHVTIIIELMDGDRSQRHPDHFIKGPGRELATDVQWHPCKFEQI